MQLPNTKMDTVDWAMHLLLAAIEGRVRIQEQSTSFRGWNEPEDSYGVTTGYKISVDGYVDDHTKRG